MQKPFSDGAFGQIHAALLLRHAAPPRDAPPQPTRNLHGTVDPLKTATSAVEPLAGTRKGPAPKGISPSAQGSDTRFFATGSHGDLFLAALLQDLQLLKLKVGVGLLPPLQLPLPQHADDSHPGVLRRGVLPDTGEADGCVVRTSLDRKSVV